eukprot:gene18698-biopygen5439
MSSNTPQTEQSASARGKCTPAGETRAPAGETCAPAGEKCDLAGEKCTPRAEKCVATTVPGGWKSVRQPARAPTPYALACLLQRMESSISLRFLRRNATREASNMPGWRAAPVVEGCGGGRRAAAAVAGGGGGQQRTAAAVAGGCGS